MSEFTREFLSEEIPRAVGTLLVLLPKLTTEQMKLIFGTLVLVNGDALRKEKDK
jgi:hypothetical protein